MSAPGFNVVPFMPRPVPSVDAPVASAAEIGPDGAYAGEDAPPRLFPTEPEEPEEPGAPEYPPQVYDDDPAEILRNEIELTVEACRAHGAGFGDTMLAVRDVIDAHVVRHLRKNGCG